MEAERRATMSREVDAFDERVSTAGEATSPGARLLLEDEGRHAMLDHAALRDSSVNSETPAARLDGEVREVSVVMADLRGFTRFCERVDPGLMSRVLNEYLTAMIDVILGQHGLVQDFIGDGVLGIFGAPGEDPDHAWHAVLSALEMQVAIRRLSSQWKREHGIALTLGVAIHSGEAFAGTVGSPRHRKYAVVGDPVNTAARLEGVNRDLGTEIVMTRDTLARMQDLVDVQPRGSFAVRGRDHAVEVFELRGLQRAPVPAARRVLSARLSLA